MTVPDGAGVLGWVGMSSGNLWFAFGALIIFVIYVVAKVWSYMRDSEAQWEQVDKSKLREWDDEDD